MRWTIRIVAALLLLLAVYTAWPLWGLYRLGAALEARNPAAVAELVEFPALRRSLTEQLVVTYLKLSGKDAALGPLGANLAVGIGSTIADPIVARLLNPETLVDLLTRGEAQFGAEAGGLAAPLNAGALRSLWQLWLGADYSGGNVYVALPPGKRAAEQFRVRLRLVQWRWKLAGLDLPEALRVRIAQELLRQNPV